MALSFSKAYWHLGGEDLGKHNRNGYEIFTRYWYQCGGTKSRVFFDITDLDFQLQTKVPKNPIIKISISRYVNFTKYCSFIIIDVKNKFGIFQIDNSTISYFTEQTVKCCNNLVCKYRAVYKI